MRVNWFKLSNSNDGTAGFTLVEALVSVAVLGILTVVLANVITQVSQAALKQRALGTMITNLNIAGNQIIDDLRSVARNSGVNKSFRFIGRDGDGTFEKSTTVDHESIGITTGGDVDHMHYHNYYSDEEMSNPLQKATPKNMDSDRVRLCYYLCNPNHADCSYSVLGGEMGIMKRRDVHTQEDINTAEIPVPELSIDLTSNQGANPMAFNVDYISFRYYDNSTGTWSNSWDSDSKGGDFPDAVEFALRGYDPGGAVSPEWYIGYVAIRSNT